MKHLNYLLLGAAGLVLASCANEDLVGPNVNPDGTANVTINLNAPQISSRAYSDGTTAQQLQYAVYYVDKDNKLTILPDHTHATATESANPAETINISKQVNFKLVTGRTYAFVFWAGSATAPYTIDFAEDGATMKVNYVNNNGVPTLQTANNENLDGFFACVTQPINGDTSFEAHLYRPFAQINVGTNDYVDAVKSGFEPSESHIQVSKVYKTLDLVKGTVSGDYGNVDYVYNALPVTLDATGKVTTGETFPVEGYDYMSMIYALVDNTTDQPLVDVTFDCKDNKGKENGAYRKVTNVPVKRNYRTNIFGQLFTSNVDVNVIIEPNYLEPNYDVNAHSLLRAGIEGGSILLDGDVILNGEDLAVLKDLTIDLNGYTLYLDKSATVRVKDGSVLTITGDGLISKISTDPTKTTGCVSVENGSTLNIEGGNYISDQLESIYIVDGVANIKGGFFSSKNPYGGVYFTLNCLDSSYNDGIATFVVTGGTFANFNPASSAADKKDGQNVNWVADGYKSVLSQDSNGNIVYTVIPEEFVLVGSVADIINALKDGETQIMLEPKEYEFKDKTFYDEGNQTFHLLSPEVTIEGNGAIFKGTYSPNFLGATVRNVTFKPEPGKNTFGSFNGKFINCSFLGGVNTESKANKSSFDNCKFICDPDTGLMAFHIGIVNEDNTIVLNNCVIDGRCDFGVSGAIDFNNCTLYIKGTEWGFYNDGQLNFNNCTIAAGSKDMVVIKDNGNIYWN